MTYDSELEALFATLSGEVQKVAAAPVAAPATTEDHVKLAEDIYAAGEIMADAFVNRALEKLASVPAAGGGTIDGNSSPRSTWESIAQRIATAHGRKASVGDDTSVRTEDNMGGGAGHNKGKAGPTGTVNTQKSLG